MITSAMISELQLLSPALRCMSIGMRLISLSPVFPEREENACVCVPGNLSEHAFRPGNGNAVKHSALMCSCPTFQTHFCCRGIIVLEPTV